jgi:subtilisin family serine protease
VLTTIDLRLAQQLAALPEVGNIQPNPWTMLDRPIPDNTPTGGTRGVVEWGVERINADDVWNLGFRGEGIVVGGQDTGYEWIHPTIQQQYRGYDGTNADHNYHWHDAIREISLLHNDPVISPDNNPCGLDVDAPCDDHDHGTHTMGTMVGDDGGDNQIGVAPAAKWIGCRNMERGWGSPASYIECFDWFLAPTDLNGEFPDPAMAPHVIANSWGCPEIEGCNADNFALMETAVDALRAAGVVVVVSAGNDGAACETVMNPAAIFESSFSIGATNSMDNIAGFSSRGSVTVDGSLRLKPNVVAPGVQIRSATRNGGYATWNGTSMAGPHVAGAVALLLSAAPHLEGEVDSIEAILEATAVPLLSEQDCNGFPGMVSPNAVYGYGRIDVLAAVEQSMQEVVSTIEATKTPYETFPNPARDQWWVSGPETNETQLIELYDGLGRRVKSLSFRQQVQRIDVSDLTPGIYSYRIGYTDQWTSGKLLVIK